MNSELSLQKNKKATDKNVRNLVCSYTLWLSIGAFCLIFPLLFINLGLLETKAGNFTSSNTTHSTNATNDESYEESKLRSFEESGIDKKTVLRSSVDQGNYNNTTLRSSGYKPCTYTLRYGACVFTCRYIYNPGKIVGPYLEDIVDSLNCTVVHVEIHSSDFPGNKLSKGWFPYTHEKKLTSLRLLDCNITAIEEDAFEDMEDLQKLLFEKLQITELQNIPIKNLTGLKELYLNYYNNLNSIENQILSNFTKFETLQMMNFTNIEYVLPNITGNTMESISMVDFRYNNMPILKPSFFKGIDKCLSFYFTGSNIKHIEPKTFHYPIQMFPQAQIYLDSNLLETLAEDAINLNHFRRINLQNNPWRCNCSLVWLAKKLQYSHYREKFEGEVICRYPEELNGTKLTESGIIESCYSNTTTSTTEINQISSTTSTSTTTVPTTATMQPTTVIISETTTTESSTTIAATITTTTTTTAEASPPPSPLPSTESSSTLPQETTTTTDFSIMTPTGTPPIQIKTSSPNCPKHDNTLPNANQINKNYTIQEKRVGILSVQVPSYENGWRLYLSEQNKNPCWYSTTDGVSVSFELKLSEGQQYLFCMLPEGSTSDFDQCQAYTMQVREEKRAWLLREAITPTILIAIGAALLVCLVTAGVVYICILCHPTSIKSNKRVIIVHHRSSAKVLVMPKDYKGNSPDSKEKVKVTKSMPCGSTSQSTASSPRSSTTTYISVTETTPEQILAFQKENPTKGISSSTPLPPPRPTVPAPCYSTELQIPTLSLKVSKESEF